MDHPSQPDQVSPDGAWRWDGHSWVPNTIEAAPPIGQQPYGQYPQTPYGQHPQTPYGGYQQPPKQSNTLRNVLLILGLVFILFAGGCVAIVGLAVNEVDNAVDDLEENDDAPGGVDNPLEITEGRAFTVYGFDYQSGWRIQQDDLGDLEIANLKFENNREEPDSAVVDITFLKANEVVAQLDCSSDTAAVGQVATLTCFSSDPVPAGYDSITISDSY